MFTYCSSSPSLQYVLSHYPRRSSLLLEPAGLLRYTAIPTPSTTVLSLVSCTSHSVIGTTTGRNTCVITDPTPRAIALFRMFGSHPPGASTEVSCDESLPSSSRQKRGTLSVSSYYTWRRRSSQRTYTTLMPLHSIR